MVLLGYISTILRRTSYLQALINFQFKLVSTIHRPVSRSLDSSAFSTLTSRMNETDNLKTRKIQPCQLDADIADAQSSEDSSINKNQGDIIVCTQPTEVVTATETNSKPMVKTAAEIHFADVDSFQSLGDPASTKGSVYTSPHVSPQQVSDSINGSINTEETESSTGESIDKISESAPLEEVQTSSDIHHPEKHLNQRKRKSKNLKLHATFKRPKLTSDDEISRTVHYFENGLRKVVPYDFKYNTFCKGRWVGKTLGELYTKEFRLYPIEYYKKAVEDQRILVNLKPAKSLSRVVKNNDLISSVSHRHECPVSAAPISIVADTEDFFVINKPCSIPLHPAGRFRHNSVLSILAREFDRKEIFSIHRLDRMTSGLTVFTKSRERASKCHSQIKERQVEKEYICRVTGDFTKFSLPDNHDHHIEIHDGVVTVRESMKVYDMKIGTSIVSRDDDAKDCVTSFHCLSTNGKTSVVSCRPKTGRTHQIRVHLQYLGFPISNDPMYNTSAWGEERFQLGPISKPMQDVMHELSSLKKWVTLLESFNDTVKENKDENIESVEVATATEDTDTINRTPELSPVMMEAAAKVEGIVPYRSDCEECKNPLPDPKPEELVMYLHAFRYKGLDWEFETPLPDWASSEWAEDANVC